MGIRPEGTLILRYVFADCAVISNLTANVDWGRGDLCRYRSEDLVGYRHPRIATSRALSYVVG